MKKANSQAFRIAEVRKSARKFLHGRNFKQQSNKKSRLDKKKYLFSTFQPISTQLCRLRSTVTNLKLFCIKRRNLLFLLAHDVFKI